VPGTPPGAGFVPGTPLVPGLVVTPVPGLVVVAPPVLGAVAGPVVLGRTPGAVTVPPGTVTVPPPGVLLLELAPDGAGLVLVVAPPGRAATVTERVLAVQPQVVRTWM
jgi:hypothetical protein